MNIRDELLKLQNVLTDLKFISTMDSFLKDPVVAGRFNGRDAQFGIRNVGGKKEAFYQIRLFQVVPLPFWLQRTCPLRAEALPLSESMNLAIDHKRWLTASKPLSKKEDSYFASRTEETVRQLFESLAHAAGKIERKEFSLENNIQAFQRTGVQDFFKTLTVSAGITLAILVLVAIAVFSSKFLMAGKKEVLKKQTELPAGAHPQNPLAPSNQSIFLRVTPNKSSVLFGEMITLSYDLFTRYETRYWGLYQEGDFSGFQISHQEDYPKLQRRMVELQGKKYAQSTVRTMILIPAGPGKKTIHPGIGFVSVKKQNGEIIDMYLPVEPLELTVQG